MLCTDQNIYLIVQSCPFSPTVKITQYVNTNMNKIIHFAICYTFLRWLLLLMQRKKNFIFADIAICEYLPSLVPYV